MLKNGSIHQIIMEEEQKDHYIQKKKVISLFKDEKDSKIIRKFTTTTPKTYVNRVQKMIIKLTLSL